jgi:ribose transport system substrate-binding protein
MYRYLKFTFLLLVISIFFVCNKTPMEKDRIVIAFSQCNGAEPWRVLFDRQLKAEAAKYSKIKLIYADAQNNSSKQIADMENFILQGVHCILISPKESAPLTAPVETAFKKGIPVIVLDRGVNTENYSCFIGGDNLEIGRAAGEYAVRILEGKGKVVEIWGLKGSTPAQERHQGFHDIIKNHPGIQVIVEQEGRWLRPNGRSLMENILKAQPEIDLVYAHNDPMALGAYLAAKDVKREKDIKFIGIDGNPGPEGGCQAVIDGKLEATFLYPTPGAEGIKQALKILKKVNVPKKILLPTVTITRENAAQYANR